jgi:hypothetical protein
VPAPTEIHLYYDPDHETADIVVVYGIGSGVLATKLRGSAHLDFGHDHRPGGIAPSADVIRFGLEFRDALPVAGRHRLGVIPEETAA